MHFQFNFTHTINRLSFGEDYPGQVNPLDNFSDVSTENLPTGTEVVCLCVMTLLEYCLVGKVGSCTSTL